MWNLREEKAEAEGCMKLPTLTTAATARMKVMACNGVSAGQQRARRRVCAA